MERSSRNQQVGNEEVDLEYLDEIIDGAFALFDSEHKGHIGIDDIRDCIQKIGHCTITSQEAQCLLNTKKRISLEGFRQLVVSITLDTNNGIKIKRQEKK